MCVAETVRNACQLNFRWIISTDVDRPGSHIYLIQWHSSPFSLLVTDKILKQHSRFPYFSPKEVYFGPYNTDYSVLLVPKIFTRINSDWLTVVPAIFLSMFIVRVVYLFIFAQLPVCWFVELLFLTKFNKRGNKYFTALHWNVVQV